MMGGVLHLISGWATLSFYSGLVSPSLAPDLSNNINIKLLQSSSLSYPRTPGIALASLTLLTGFVLSKYIFCYKFLFAVHTLADLCNLCHLGEVYQVSTGIPLYNNQKKPKEQKDTRN